MSIRQTAVPTGYALGAVLLPWLAHRYGFGAAAEKAATAAVPKSWWLRIAKGAGEQGALGAGGAAVQVGPRRLKCRGGQHAAGGACAGSVRLDWRLG